MTPPGLRRMGWLTGFGEGGQVDRDQILRLSGEREPAGRAEVVRADKLNVLIDDGSEQRTRL